MKPGSKRVLTLLLAVVASVGTASGATAASSDTSEYVALGDSYASGVGTSTYDPSGGDCRRSPLGYPTLWAKSHPQYTLKNVSCSGATVADVEAGQLSALSSETDRITITVGGNDVGFTSTLENCLTGDDNLCGVSTQLSTFYAENYLKAKLDSLFSKIHERAPQAKVYVLGYPHLVAPAGTCNLFSSTSPKPAMMNATADAVDEAVKNAAATANFGFIDVRQRFSGHEACGTDAWINSVNLTQLVESFHPTADGYAQGYAPYLDLFMG
ncbi:SGNH/GDSL hydrolase family protein [Streptomyces tendae]|uniref:SGNH/GDSL hydrolase family protein n=1 Tax=Streptomyces tendae TaxID=1932 RepID=UPI00379CC50A